MMISALALLGAGRSLRDLYLFDTFEGLPRPEEIDRDLWGQPSIEIWEKFQKDSQDTLAFSGIEEVRKNMASTGYPSERVHYIPGLVEDTLPQSAPESIALLRIDTDWHSSVAHSLETLFDRVVSGGFVLIDDYGHFESARKAVDAFLTERGLRVFLQRIDYTGRMFQKP